MTGTPPMLGPVIALAVWTGVMWAWMYVTRIPAIMKARMRLDPNAPRGEQMAQLPPRVRWKADNYNHLMAQPTVFFAVALALAILGVSSPLAMGLAWTYVVLRIVHSLWQAAVNRIPVRFTLFLLSTLCLLALSLLAVIATLG